MVSVGIVQEFGSHVGQVFTVAVGVVGQQSVLSIVSVPQKLESIRIKRLRAWYEFRS
jgi:hypothetical protein